MQTFATRSRQLGCNLQRVLMVCRKTSALGWLRHSLARDYEVREIDDPACAINIIAAKPPRLVVVELDLGTASGLDMLRRLPRHGMGRPPVVVIGHTDDVRLAVVRTRDMADLVLTQPLSEARILRGVWRLLDRTTEAVWQGLPEVQRSYLRTTLKSFNDLARDIVKDRRVSWETVESCAATVLDATRDDIAPATLEHLKDFHHQSYVHALRVATSMTLFGAEIGLRQTDLAMLTQAGLLHDVSVNLLPAEVVNKPGSLNDGEWQMVRGHPLVSKRLLENSDGIPAPVINAALNHHERLDGSGYPNGLKGGQIDDLSMICAIADVYSALTSRRAHRPAVSGQQAMDILAEKAGRELDGCFLRRFKDVVAYVEGW